jgi:hypothetical protein
MNTNIIDSDYRDDEEVTVVAEDIKGDNVAINLTKDDLITLLYGFVENKPDDEEDPPCEVCGVPFSVHSRITEGSRCDI